MRLMIKSLIPALCLAIIAPTSSLAHKVNVFAYFEGNSIIVEGYFSKNSKAKNCQTIFYDHKGQKIHSGVTNEKGQYSVDASKLGPLTGDITIELDTGDGHKATYKLPIDEAPENIVGNKENPGQTQESVVKDTESNEQDIEEKPSLAPGASGKDLQGLEETIQKIVAQENAKTIKMISNVQRLILEERNSGPSIRDVIGGLGWIMGLLGIATYFYSRKP